MRITPHKRGLLEVPLNNALENPPFTPWHGPYVVASDAMLRYILGDSNFQAAQDIRSQFEKELFNAGYDFGKTQAETQALLSENPGSSLG